jgi:hypothetical protein
MALFMRTNPTIKIVNWHIVVYYNYKDLIQYRIISEAGFGIGMVCGLILFFINSPSSTLVDKLFIFVYWCILTTHFLVYPWTAIDNANDFSGMCSHAKE